MGTQDPAMRTDSSGPAVGLRLSIHGPPEQEGRLRLPDFLRFFGAVSATLARVDRVVSGGSRTADYVIEDLSVGSAALEVRAVPRRGKPDHGPAIVSTWLHAVEEIQVHGRRPEGFDDDALEAFARLTRPLGNGIGRIDAECGAQSLRITRRLEDSVDGLLGLTIAAKGTVSGQLDAINVHTENTFHVYPVIGGGRVLCRFPSEMLPQAGSALRRYVTVSGTMHYRPNDALPREAQVEALQVHPDDAELPTLASLRGMAPELTGDVDTITFLRELRDGEEA